MRQFFSSRPWVALSVRQTLVLGAGLSILVPALVLAYFQIANRLDKDVELRVSIPMQQYADVLARGVAVAIWNLDRGVATELVDAVMRNPDVARVTVSDEYKEVFVKRQVEGMEEGDILREERAVTYSGKRVGHLVVEMTTTRVKREFIGDLSKLGLALLAQVVTSFIFILVLLERRMIRPLRELQAGTTRLAQGELDRPLHWFRKDEFGRLADGLDGMRQNLSALLSEREQKNRELEYELQERKRTECALVFSQAKFAAIFDGSPVAMTVSHNGADYRVRDLNAAWERMFHRRRSEIVDSSGSSNGIWCQQSDRDAMLAALQRTGGISSTEAWMCRGDGLSDILVAITGRTIVLDAEQLLILAYEDITEKRRIEGEIRSLNATLEVRVTERTQELTEAMDRLQATQSELVRSEKLSALGSLVAGVCLLYTSPSPRDATLSRMPSSA